ncbi:MAG: CBS domain-containing protein [Deltaproteobacteria bacterium]|nr:CBS domain-containing protein [Deltaproteobacteria bacterium]
MDIITTHINADFDALASMLAAKKIYPDAKLVFPGAQEKSIRDFLLQSTLYLMDIEKAGNISLKDVTRLILVDIRQGSRIGKFESLCTDGAVEIHIYDHHPPAPDDITGTFEVIKPYGATTTIMCEILQQKKIVVTPDEATVFMIGIYEDTGNLTFSSTAVEDYHAAAYLLSQGAHLNTVSDLVVKELTVEQVSMLNEMIENAAVNTIKGVDVMIARASSENYVGDFAVLVHKLKNMENVNVLFALANMDDRIYIVGRSRIQEVNAAEVLLEFGGGGHATAASATVHDMTLVQVEQRLLKILQKKIEPVKVARDFMTTPVKTVALDETLLSASKLLTRYNINVLPVTSGRKLVGIVSRQMIDRAKHHGLEHSPVSEFMSTDYFTVKPATALAQIKQHIVDDNQRFLPVVSRGHVTGAITRTDLLRILHVDTSDAAAEVESARSPQGRKKQMKSLLRERLSGEVFALLHDIGRTADQLNCNAYAVGGFVRDVFLRVPDFDIDIVIEGDGIQFARKFAERYGYHAKVYKKFGTACIDTGSDIKIDVASSRMEYYEKPAALPKVEWGSIKLDLYRRDFTINTLALCLNPKFFGELIDFFGARRDIKEKTVRVLHNLSFVEDPSRIFRAIRFEQRFGFHLSKLTKSLIDNAVKMEFLNDLSGKRIFSELVLMLKEEQVLAILKRLSEFGLLGCINPVLKYDAYLRNLMKNIDEVLSWYDLLYLDNTCEKWFVFMLGLFDRLQSDEVEKLCRHFDIKNKYAVPVHIAKTTGNDVLYSMSRKKILTKSYIYSQLHGLPVEVALYLMARTGRKSTKQAFSLYFTQLQHTKLHLNGNDLIRIGIAPGRVYKKIMQTLLEAVLNGEVKGKAAELQFVKLRYHTGMDAGQDLQHDT